MLPLYLFIFVYLLYKIYLLRFPILRMVRSSLSLIKLCLKSYLQSVFIFHIQVTYISDIYLLIFHSHVHGITYLKREERQVTDA